MRAYETISPWLVRRIQGRESSNLRWIIFTYAGSSPTALYPWANQIDQEEEVIIVNLPGRGNRMLEPPQTDLNAIVKSIHYELDGLRDLPTIYFGYSLGSLIAYELCHQHMVSNKTPIALLVAAGSAPHKIGERDKVFNLQESAFWDKVKSYGGMPQEVIDEPELVKLVEPILRADFSLIDCYEYSPREKLSIPIMSVAGIKDKVCPPKYVKEWGSHTNNEFSYFEFDGGHFFINDVGEELYKLFRKELRLLTQTSKIK